MADRPIVERLEDLRKRKEQALQPGAERSVKRQHDRGKMLARERIDYLSSTRGRSTSSTRSPATATRPSPIGPTTDGVITGWGTVDGRKVFVFSQDFTLFGGALGEVFAEKIHKLMDLALKVGAPVVGLNDGAGLPHPGRPGQPRLLNLLRDRLDHDIGIAVSTACAMRRCKPRGRTRKGKQQ